MTTLWTGSRWCCCILLLFFALPAYTQTNITGRVVDEKDNTPLEGASVYFNNTTISTYTTVDGDFHFEGIRMLNTEIVIYAPGYEVLVYKPTPKQIEGKRIVFKLHAKALEAVTKLPVKDTERFFLGMFRQFFLGVTEEANTCEIVNEKSIYITQAESDNSFNICADTALVIINSWLGYKIIYNLEEFWYDYATGKPHFSGYARYEELGSATKWIKHRDKAYHGSKLHFYRSLVNHQLYEQGFEIFLMKPLPDSTDLTLQPHFMITPEGCVVKAEPLSAENILFIDSTNEISIKLADELWVQYNKNPVSKYFLIARGFMDNLGIKGVESTIQFKKSPVGINYNGVLDDYTNIEYTGYWIYEKLANTLPLNYQPFNSR